MDAQSLDFLESEDWKTVFLQKENWSKEHSMNKICLCLLALSGMVGFGNCASASAGLATSNIPVGDKKYTILGPVEKSTRFYAIDFGLVAFPTERPPLSRLVDEAMAEKSADALVNIRYWNDRIIFLFITIHRIGLQAEAIKFEDAYSFPPVGPAKKK